MDIVKKKRLRRIGFAALLVLILALGCTLYLNDYYRADTARIDAFLPEAPVEITQTSQNDLIFTPEQPEAGLIFYPGGKVEHTAYAPLMKALAARGILCVLVKMPCHLAVLDMGAAEGIPEQFPEIDRWYIAGHSLGGAMAASYLIDHGQDFAGLVLLGAYSTADLSDTSLRVLSLYGSQDRVMNKEKYDTCLSNLPKDFREILIDGGCHAYFGMYGAQEGDGIPAISPEDQIFFTAEAIAAWIAASRES